jgi:hypothetical protein
VAVYSRQFVEDVRGREMAAMCEGVDLGSYGGVPAESQHTGRAIAVALT